MKLVDKIAFGSRVKDRREELGISQGALAERVGMKQQGVGEIERGVVARPRKLHELVAVLQTTAEWLLYGEGDEPSEPITSALEAISVPLISWVSAGKLVDPLAAVPNDDVPLLAFSDLGRGEFFALRVIGDSMDRISPDQSIILINRKDKTLVHGRYYVFSRRGETTYKRWHTNPDYLAPYSTNPSNEPIFLKNQRDYAVVGRVRRTVLDL